MCVAKPGTATRGPVSVTAPSIPDQESKAARVPESVTDAPDEDLPF